MVIYSRKSVSEAESNVLLFYRPSLQGGLRSPAERAGGSQINKNPLLNEKGGKYQQYTEKTLGVSVLFAEMRKH